MNHKTRTVLLEAGAVLGFTAASAAASWMLYKQTLPRPKGTSQDIIDEFADPEKFKEYETPDLSKDYSEWRFSYVEDGQECNFKIRFEAIRA